jgi:hypothetical protein
MPSKPPLPRGIASSVASPGVVARDPVGADFARIVTTVPARVTHPAWDERACLQIALIA